MSERALRIGTRGSDLALWQARHVAALLARLPGAPPTELVLIRTEGDRITDVPLAQVAVKAFFTKEIEEALRAGSVDLAVHSLKDLATEMPAGLALGAVLEREDPRDALLARAAGSLDELPAGARVGTSSLRRRALLARWRSDLELVDLRGNVPTRVERLDQGRFDAIVLAAAGVHRLGLAGRISSYLPVDRVPPAVAQGAVAVQLRADDARAIDWVARLDHAPTHTAAAAERALLRALEGGCQIPVGALAEVRGERLSRAATVCALAGRRSVADSIEGAAAEAEALGAELARRLLAAGAAEILAAIRGGQGERR